MKPGTQLALRGIGARRRGARATAARSGRSRTSSRRSTASATPSPGNATSSTTSSSRPSSRCSHRTRPATCGTSASTRRSTRRASSSGRRRGSTASRAPMRGSPCTRTRGSEPRLPAGVRAPAAQLGRSWSGAQEDRDDLRPRGCYHALLIREFETGKPEAYQLKYYGKASATSASAGRANDEDHEELRLVKISHLNAARASRRRATRR